MNGDITVDPTGGFNLTVDVNEMDPSFGGFFGGPIGPQMEQLPIPPAGGFTMAEPLIVDVYGGIPEENFMAGGPPLLPSIEPEGFSMAEPLIVDVFAGTPTPIPFPIPGEFPTVNPFQPVQPVTFPQSFYALNPQTGGIEPEPTGGPSIVDFVDTSYPSIPGVLFPSLPSLPNLVEAAVSGLTSGLTTTQRAPKATIFTGTCPPGRVRRRISLGRDVCAKKPRMNMCNQHALSRASRRVAGFLHLAKSTEKRMRESFAPLLRTPKRSTRGGGCAGCGARRRSACVC